MGESNDQFKIVLGMVRERDGRAKLLAKNGGTPSSDVCESLVGSWSK